MNNDGLKKKRADDSRIAATRLLQCLNFRMTKKVVQKLEYMKYLCFDK